MKKLVIRATMPAMLALGIAVMSGCDSGLVDVPEPSDPGPIPPQTSFRMVDASLEINGVNYGSRISISDESFSLLFIYVEGHGLFTVVAEPTARSVDSGFFDGGHLRFDLGGVSVRISSGEPILGVAGTWPAWVEHTPNYTLLPSNVQPPDVVIGLADTRDQIPGAEYLN